MEAGSPLLEWTMPEKWQVNRGEHARHVHPESSSSLGVLRWVLSEKRNATPLYEEDQE
ncbi:hypothetical protein PILCRDRAFT_816400 [Piloderma croceum F 1598]|uniref:Uncharacterized protein n=1 Tax=Piloderma croceum (strain F 1598) TaxID=765440 RepID=A0A0C3G3G0_PILCF|nr:hypothetical protein PILCRDRAFT_816400 [Piloderma croceum F 1598]